MLKIKRLLFYIGMLCCAAPIWAQPMDAKGILDCTTENLRNAGGVRATFTIRTSNGNSTGVIRLKGDKFRLEAEGITTWFDGRTQWSYLTSSQEVNVSEPTAEELQSINPYALLSLYKQGYKEKLGKINNAQDNSLYKVVLTATDRNQDLQSITLYVTKESFRPARISMTQRGARAESVVIIIDSYQDKQSYPDSLFRFDKKAYPKAEVIDLR